MMREAAWYGTARLGSARPEGAAVTVLAAMERSRKRLTVLGVAFAKWVFPCTSTG